MKRGIKVAAAVAGGVALGTAAVVTTAGMLWGRATARAAGRITGRSSASNALELPATFSPEELDGLPAPAVRYFTFALTPGQPLVRSARVRWEGEFRSRADAAWAPFTAAQQFGVRPPGFVWDARIAMGPLIAVRVRDSYLAGEGRMYGAVAALVPVVDQRGTPEMAAGALSRYLGECVWLPTALLPSAGVTWSPIDDSTARATLADGATTVSADFHFGPRGEVVRTTMTRFRDVDGVGVPTPFAAVTGGEYRRVSGMMIPAGGEAAWVLPEGPLTYWRGRIADVRYDFVRRR
jgi:hypothetical protein